MRLLKTIALTTLTTSLALSTYAHAQKITVGAMLLDTKGEWMSEVMHGMKKAGKDLNVKVVIADSNTSLSKESAMMDNFIAQQVDAITASPQSNKGSVVAFERATRAGIPVVAWNTKVASKSVKYFVGVNNYDLGKRVGVATKKYIQTKLHGKANIGVIGISRLLLGTERVNGFVDQLKGMKGVKFIARQDAEFQEKGMAVTENIVQAHPETNIIFAWNLTSMLGAYTAVKSGHLKNVTVVGVDMSIDVARFMLEKNSSLKIVATQQPFVLGYKAIETSVKLAQHKSAPATTIVDLKDYTSADKKGLQQYIASRKYLHK